ncbi:MAG: sensor histidine kinase [Saccharospirillaceae bacterium]|nr:sensor histidine kinase [Pseudomonadales bacterium]NRB79701.1 sensor histidine kinase [Saccharospirillaceae bacterium]
MLINLIKKIDNLLLPKEQDLGLTPYFLLFYLFFFFGNFIFEPIYGWAIVYVVVNVIAFLFMYFKAFDCHGNNKNLTIYLLGIFIIGVLMSQINIGASTFFVFISGFTSGYKNRKQSFIALIILLLSICVYTVISQQPIFFWVPAIFMSAMIGVINIQQVENYHKNKALKQSQEEIQTLAKMAERERISRDLHDLLGHSLSVITLKAELAVKMIDKGKSLSDIKQEIKSVELLSRSTLAQVRDAVRNYNQAKIKSELLHAVVATQAAKIELIHDIQIHNLDSTIETQLALIIREAITNVVRHADTKKVWVNLTTKQTQLILEISDQGNTDTFSANNGLSNMLTRIEKINGNLSIQNQPNTKLTFSCPTQLDPQQDKQLNIQHSEQQL